MAIGTKGFIASLHIIIYDPIRNACKNIYVKIIVHATGIIVMVLGIFLLITTMPSLTSIGGVFLIFIGLFIFVIPLGIDHDYDTDAEEMKR